MKSVYLYCLIFLLSTFSVHAQSEDNSLLDPSVLFSTTNPLTGQSMLSGNLGYLNIGGDDLIGLRFTPELSLRKVGIGLDIPLYYNMSKNNFRTELYKDNDEVTVGSIMRMVRYVRFGRKRVDNFYIRGGDLTGAYIGYGLMLSNYSNTYSEEKRKLGVEFDMSLGDNFGVEGLYSHINNSLNLMAVRPYLRPFAKTSIPIVKTIEMGVGLFADFDSNPDSIYTSQSSYNNLLQDGLVAGSADLGFTIFKSLGLRIDAAVQAGGFLPVSDTAIATYNADPNNAGNLVSPSYGRGWGVSAGLTATAELIFDVLVMGVKLDRIWFSDNFLPQFFDMAYEINKDAKIVSLSQAEARAGILGTLRANVLGLVNVSGTLNLPDDGQDAAIMLSARLQKIMDKYSFTGRYYKGNLSGLGQAFDLDQGVASVSFDYTFMKVLNAGITYNRTFLKGADGKLGFNDQIMPYVGVRWNPFEKQESESQEN